MGIKNLATLIFPAFAGPQQNGEHDALTGVASAQLFIERASAELEGCRESGRSVSLLVCNMDDLNGIANKFGVKSAEQAIKLFSTIVRNEIDDHTKIGRLSNGSFAVILTNSNLQVAALKAETIRAAVSSISINGPMAGHKFTASIGVALASGLVEDAVDSANSAAKQAFSQGGDRVRLSGTGESRSSNQGASEEYAARTEQLRDVA